MGKKKSKPSLKTWGCNYGCDVSKAICPHIERELPQLINTLSRARLKEQLLASQVSGNFDQESKTLINDLMLFGLTREDCEIVLDRYVSNLELGEIRDKYHFVSVSSLKYYFKLLQPKLEKALRKLYPEGDGK